ncbi:hypothetical protein SAMN05444487_114107 [Marininema mesophilum]|uniref:Uncharacterized protein n=1 Tax=Marininema mesophilum TaxID=1048340 RepID=A0A1H3AY90_9BACL|nr:hypothetical protein [Marininema mesophilum]SDX34555.1 hypothetical protein SAMN05444487_114107 [Marininema mesophilum]
MKNGKRRLFTGVMALLLAASVSVGASSKAFAAQKKDAKLPDKYIQGYKVDSKDGKKTPVYNTTPQSKGNKLLDSPQNKEASPYEANYPKLSEDPYAPAPESGTTTTDSGKIGDVVYFKLKGVQAHFNGSKEFTDAGVYLEKKSDGTIEKGLYDVKTGATNTAPVETINNERAQHGEAWMVEKYGPSMAWSKAFDGTSKLKRESKYKLLGTSTVANSAEWWSGLDIKHGVSKTESYSFAWTIGFKFSVEEGGGIVPGKVTEEFSTDLTNTFGEEIAISDEVTYKDQTRVPKADNSAYQYDVYRGALYQLTNTYTLEPGTGLQELINAEEYPGDYGFKQGLANPSFQYNSKELYYPITPGSHVKPGEGGEDNPPEEGE